MPKISLPLVFFPLLPFFALPPDLELEPPAPAPQGEGEESEDNGTNCEDVDTSEADSAADSAADMAL